MSKIFRVTKAEVPIIFLSLIGGYPVGANMIVSYLENGTINLKQANRLLLFCVNSGPAFLIGAISIPLFNNIYVGLIIYLSHIISCIIISNITTHKDIKENNIENASSIRFDDAILHSAKSASSSIMLICTLIILFSAIYSVIESLGIIELLKSLTSIFLDENIVSAILSGLLEICKGCTELTNITGIAKPILASGLTAFSGLCVCIQVSAITNKHKLNIKHFILFRFIHSFISMLTTYILLKIFKINCLASVNTSLALSTTTNDVHISSLFLIGICILLLLNVEKSAIMNRNKKD